MNPTGEASGAGAAVGQEGGSLDPAEGQSAALTREWAGRGLLRRMAVVTGLAVAGFVGPLLDLYGRTPDAWVASRAGRSQIVLFGLGVVLLIPVCYAVLQVLARPLGPRATSVMHRLAVAGLGVAVGLVVSRQLVPTHSKGATALALAIAVVVYVLATKISTVVAIAGLGAPVLLGLFLFASPTSQLIWASPEPELSPQGIGSPHSIVMLQLDELPLATLMDVDGTVNESLFPNFARLADDGTWYRNALSDSIATSQSVPAILSGTIGVTGQGSSYQTRPNNLFTLLGSRYEMHVIEWVTELCAQSTCPEFAGRPAPSFGDLLLDVGVVYGHLTLPNWGRERLPRIDNAWTGFVGQAEEEVSHEVAVPGLPVPDEPFRDDWISWAQRLTNGIGADGSPTLSFAHLNSPHGPWNVNPTGTHYRRRPHDVDIGVDSEGFWPTSRAVSLVGFQRHLYQVGGLDAVLGHLLDHLEEEGLWDEVMIIVVADHGASFVPGEHRRWPYEDNRDDLYRVPLFIKYPGQTQGETVDLPAFGIDVLPTIVDVLDIDTDWEFDGQSLLSLDSVRRHRPRAWCCNGEGVSTDLQVLYDQVERNHEWIPDLDSWTSVAGVGPYADLVGQEAAVLDVARDGGFRWELEFGPTVNATDRSEGVVQTLLVGTVEFDEPPPSDAMLVVLNGVIAGTAWVEPGGNEASLYGLVAEDLVLDGENHLEMLMPGTEGTWSAGSSG